MGGIGDFLFGSEPEQVGTAQSPGQIWMQSLLKPGLIQMRDRLYYGKPAWGTPDLPDVGTYDVPSMEFGSPEDYLQSGELNTAQNLMENFYSGGGGGSAMGGLSGQGANIMGNVLSDLSQGLTSRYLNAQLPYSQMEAQRNQNVWGANTNLLGQQYGLQAQAMDPRWLYGMYSGTYGSPMVQQGQQGLFQSVAPFAAIAGGTMIPGGFGEALKGLFR